MTLMRVKDLIAILHTVDPELPVHKRGPAGDFPPVDIDYLGYWLDYGNLMQSKSDPEYFAHTTDPVWSQHRGNFNEEFKAVVVW